MLITTIMKTRGHELKESKEGYMGSFGETKFLQES